MSVAFSTRRFYDALLVAYAKAPIKRRTPDYSKVCFLQPRHSIVIRSIRDKQCIRIEEIKLEMIDNSHNVSEEIVISWNLLLFREKEPYELNYYIRHRLSEKYLAIKHSHVFIQREDVAFLKQKLVNIALKIWKLNLVFLNLLSK